MNNTFNARGIVIKEVFYKDYDKIITLLLKDYGKISVSAKNSRKITNKLLAGTSLFSYCDFVLSKGKKYYYISQIDIIESFYNIRSDLDKFYYSSYFIELVERYTLENMPCNDIIVLLLKTLKNISKNNIEPKLIARIFEIKFMQLNGFMPEVNNCIYCHNTILNANTIYFNHEGVLCNKCHENNLNAIKVSLPVIYTINYILCSNTNELFNFNVSPDILEKLTIITKKIIDYHLGISLKTYDFIEELENLK